MRAKCSVATRSGIVSNFEIGDELTVAGGARGGYDRTCANARSTGSDRFDVGEWKRGHDNLYVS